MAPTEEEIPIATLLDLTIEEIIAEIQEHLQLEHDQAVQVLHEVMQNVPPPTEKGDDADDE